MHPRVKRSRFLFFWVEDRASFNISALLTGELKKTSFPQVLALSPIAETKSPVATDELGTLAQLSAEAWTPAEQLGLDSRRIDELVRQGVLLSDSEDDAEAVRLRRRDELMTARQWHPYAAFYHFMTRASENTSPAISWPDTELLAASASQDAERFVERYGPPPPAWYSVPEAVERIPLPPIERGGELYEMLRKRKTVRAFNSSRSLGQKEVATILDFVFGCHGCARLTPEVVALHKTSPSGGSLHPIEAYPLVLNVEGLSTGIHHYNVERHSLDLVHPLPPQEARELAFRVGGDQSHAGQVHLLVVLVARFFRNYWKYRRSSRTYSVILMDAAHLSQTFYLVASNLGLGAFYTAAIHPASFEEALGLDPAEEGVLGVCGCGVRALVGQPELGLDFQPFEPGKRHC